MIDPTAIVASSQPVAWHGYLAWTMLSLGFASALVVIVDELLLGHRRHMRIMNLVHPITALYWGPVWLWAYRARPQELAQVVGARGSAPPAAGRRGARGLSGTPAV